MRVVIMIGKGNDECFTPSENEALWEKGKIVLLIVISH